MLAAPRCCSPAGGGCRGCRGVRKESKGASVTGVKGQNWDGGGRVRRFSPSSCRGFGEDQSRKERGEEATEE